VFSASVVREKGTLSWKKRFFLLTVQISFFVLITRYLLYRHRLEHPRMQFAASSPCSDCSWRTYPRITSHALWIRKAKLSVRKSILTTKPIVLLCRKISPCKFPWFLKVSKKKAFRSFRFLELKRMTLSERSQKKPLRRASMLLLPLVTKTLLSSWMTTSFSLTQWVRTTAG